MKLTKFTALLAVSAISSVAVAISLMGVAGVIPMAEAGPTVWYHYAKVDPTEEAHGSKEFWAKASEGCSTAYFEAPGAGATVLERDFSGNAYFTQLEHADARYIPSIGEQERLGNWPLLSSDGKTLKYGLYPQKRVSSSTLVSALNAIPTPESNGYYLYQDVYYAKTIANPSNSNYVFDDGTTIVSGTTYWFECKPITWKVLSETDGTYYVLSETLLDAHRYNEYYEGTKGGYYANNYLNSEIRAWLNGDFYGSAFALADSAILTTNVDNSAATTNSTSNPYACENTQDKVFLPSYKDYINSSYGFSTSTTNSNTRCAKTTDWARARGAAVYSTSSSYLYNGYYWTRSPKSDGSSFAWCVFNGGNLSGDWVNSTYRGVRPSLSIVIA